MVDAICVRIARFATPTSVNGNVDWTTADLGGLTPKACRIFLTWAEVDGTAKAGLVSGIGFADGTRQNCKSLNSQDNVGTSVVGGISSITEVIKAEDEAGSVEITATVVSFIPNGVRLNFTAVAGTAKLYTVVFYAGADLSAYTSTFSGGTVNVAQDITAPGFEPDLIYAVDNWNAGGGWFSYGFCVNDGSATQKCILINNLDAQATSNCFTRFQNDSIVGVLSGVGNLFMNYQISDFDANGFSVTPRASTNSNPTHYLALNFGGSASVYGGSLDSPTSTGDDVQTGPGFKPQYVELGFTDTVAENTTEPDADAGSYGISVFDKDGNEFSNAWADEDGQTTMDTQSLSDNQAVNFASGDGAQQHAATFSTMNAIGWTLNFSVADGTARKWFGVAIGTAGGAPLAIGQAIETDTAFALGAAKVRGLGLAADAETSFAIAIGRALAIGQAADAENAFGLTVAKTVPMDQAVETDSGPVVVPLRVYGLELAQVTDSAFVIVPSLAGGQIIAVGRAQEGNSAFEITALKKKILGQAQEVDVGFAIVPLRKFSAGQAVETDTAFLVVFSKGVNVGLAIEIDTALELVLDLPPDGYLKVPAFPELLDIIFEGMDWPWQRDRPSRSGSRDE